MREVTVEEFKELIENPNETVIFRYVDLTDEIKEYLDTIELDGDNYRKYKTLLGYVQTISDKTSRIWELYINSLCFRFTNKLDFWYGRDVYYSPLYPNQIVKIIKPEKTMKTKVIKQLYNQVEVMQSLLDSKTIALKDKDLGINLRFIKLESDNFTLLARYGDNNDWEETRVLPNMEEYKVFEVEEVEEQWYDNIPEHGVLCWVSDLYKDASKEKIVEIIYKFDDTTLAPPFKSSSAGWNYAIPLTNEEISKFLR